MGGEDVQVTHAIIPSTVTSSNNGLMSGNMSDDF